MTKGFRVGVEIARIDAHTSGAFFDLATQRVSVLVVMTLDPNGSNPIVYDVALSDDTGIIFGFSYFDESLSSDSHFTDIEAPFTDQADSADPVTADIEAPLSDLTDSTDNELGFGFHHSDTGQATDLASVDIDTSTNDVAQAADQAQADVEFSASDTAQSSDSGVAYIQNYIDDYFEPDYIGQEFTF